VTRGGVLISFDADKFNLFNDNHGHDAGDVVLQAISEKVLELIPSDAVACRMGGKKFAVIAPNCTAKASEVWPRKSELGLPLRKCATFMVLCHAPQFRLVYRFTQNMERHHKCC
jgi:GGDEF domain-containing protein